MEVNCDKRAWRRRRLRWQHFWRLLPLSALMLFHGPVGQAAVLKGDIIADRARAGEDRALSKVAAPPSSLHLWLNLNETGFNDEDLRRAYVTIERLPAGPGTGVTTAWATYMDLRVGETVSRQIEVDPAAFPPGDYRLRVMHRNGEILVRHVAIGSDGQDFGPATTAAPVAEDHRGTERPRSNVVSTERFIIEAAPLPSRGSGELRVGVTLTNRRSDLTITMNFARLAILVAGGDRVIVPMIGGSSATFSAETQFRPNEPVSGELVFMTPADAEHLQLVFFTDAGPLKLDLTPDREPPALPEAVAGPQEAGPLRAVIYSVQRLDSGKGPPPRIRVDLALTLLADDPLAAVIYDPAQYVLLRTGDGRTFTPSVSGGDLVRPLGVPELWANQLTRGELAFDLGGLDEPPSALTLEVHGGGAPIAFALPVEQLFPPSPEPEPAVVARKTTR